MSVSRMLAMFMRLAMAVQVILGIAFWTGHWYGLVNVHMAVGVLFVLALWGIAGIAIAQRRSAGLALVALLWGVLVVGIGMTQKQILPGDLHWIIRVLHLAIGVASLPIAERVMASRPAPVPQVA